MIPIKIRTQKYVVTWCDVPGSGIILASQDLSTPGYPDNRSLNWGLTQIVSSFSPKLE
jgi:hypothetical protein